MDIIKEKVEELVAAIEDSSEYQNFLAARKQVDLVPGLEENYELQSSDEEGLYERMEAFEEQYEEFRRNTVVEKYLEHELRMCRMLQAINARIMDVVDLVI